MKKFFIIIGMGLILYLILGSLNVIVFPFSKIQQFPSLTIIPSLSPSLENPIHTFIQENVSVRIRPASLDFVRASEYWHQAQWQVSSMPAAAFFLDYYVTPQGTVDYLRVSVKTPAFQDFSKDVALSLSRDFFNRSPSFQCDTVQENEIHCLGSWEGANKELYRIYAMNGVKGETNKEARILLCLLPQGSSVYDNNINCRPPVH